MQQSQARLEQGQGRLPGSGNPCALQCSAARTGPYQLSRDAPARLVEVLRGLVLRGLRIGGQVSRLGGVIEAGRKKHGLRGVTRSPVEKTRREKTHRVAQ